MKLVTNHVIDAPFDAVWDLMGERFADIGQWSDTVVKSSMDRPIGKGAIRTCELKPTPAASGTIKEEITLFDRDQHAFAFDIVDGLPGFMRKVNSHWRLERHGQYQTRATNTLTIKVAWWMSPMLPVIRGQFAKTIKGFIPEIEQAAAPRSQMVEDAAFAG
ncbi:MAG: SRPBCC family protein [Boseongicola sp.]|nr:SRPBCC family protein [Boseongicola sp.]